MISDEQVREAACQVEKNLLASLPEPRDCGAVFSPRFQRKMKKLVRRTDHPVRYWVQKAVACILLVVLIGGGSVLALSTEARAAFAGWVREVRNAWFVYQYRGESQPASEDLVYCPTWVPDGYELEVKPEPNAYMIAVYRNAEDDLILFNCSMNNESTILQVGQKDAQFSNVYVGNILADLYMDKTEGNANTVVWEDEEKAVLFWIISTLNAEDMIKIAESVTTQISEE